MENGQLTTSAGVGVLAHGSPETVDAQTQFRVASLSKMVLAATAMRLREEGRLDFAQPATSYVPLTLQAPFDPASVSVANLLTHTSGVPDLGADTKCATGAGQLAAWFAAHDQQPLWSPPGALWNYSNQGFSIAGWIVEAASGQRFEDAVAQRVFGPAGMTTATYEPSSVAVNHATGRSGGQNISSIDAYDCEATRAPGGVIASVIDYAHFAETLLAGGGTMLTPASVTAMETGYVDTDQHLDGGEHYGFGLFVRDGWKGLHIVRHEGSVLGYQSSIWMVPDQKFAVIVFFNASGRAPRHVSERAIDSVSGHRQPGGAQRRHSIEQLGQIRRQLLRRLQPGTSRRSPGRRPAARRSAQPRHSERGAHASGRRRV